MSYKDAVKEFQSQFITLYLNEVDYWQAEQVWTAWVDGLCKEGRITQKQYNTWEPPFKYGKHLKADVRIRFST